MARNEVASAPSSKNRLQVSARSCLRDELSFYIYIYVYNKLRTGRLNSLHGHLRIRPSKKLTVLLASAILNLQNKTFEPQTPTN